MPRILTHRILCFLLAMCAFGACASTAQGPIQADDSALDEFRGLWITRWDYRTQADVKRIVQEAVDLGVTDIMWQARGQADAFYRSHLEPWGEELFRDLPTDARTPDFDPLRLAVEQTHMRGLRIHAWINVYPLWKGTQPPRDPGHILHVQSAWRLYDRDGKAQPLNEHYVIVNPVHKDVQDHIVAVSTDIVRRYDIDGLHLDYVRFVSETFKKHRLYPGDPLSIGMFTDATDRRGVDTDSERKEYRAFIRDHITNLVGRIKTEAVSRRHGVEFSAAVWRNPDIARDQYLQDAVKWLNEGTIDRAFPMIYTADNALLTHDLNAWLDAAPRKKITPGLGVYKHTDPRQSPVQIALSSRADGFALFGYSSIFESVDPNQPKDAAETRLRAKRRQIIGTYLNSLIRQGNSG